MSLLNRLKAVGKYDSTGEFTLDREKARQKLSRFQLTDPRRFVLEVIMAAVSAGAPSVTVRTREALSVSWPAPVLAPTALEDLERYLLEPPGPERHLAVAVNALRILTPTVARLESASGVTLDILTGEVRSTASPARNLLRVEGFAPALLEELRSLVRTECLYAPREISLDDEPLRAPTPALTREGRGVKVVGGLDAALSATELSLVHHGVVVARRSPAWKLPVRAVAHSERFTLNASHSDVVDDEVLEQAVRLAEEVGQASLEALVNNYLPGRSLNEQLFLAERLTTRQRGSAWWELPLFPLVGGGLASAATLAAQCQELGVVLLVDSPGAQPVSGLTLVQGGRPELDAALRRLFGDRVQDGQRHILEHLGTQANRQAWERNVRPAELGLGRWLARAPVTGPHFHGEIGLEAEDTDHGAVLRVLYQGRLLSTESVDTPLSYVATVDFAQLEIKADWSGPARGHLYAAALKQLEGQAEKLYLELSQSDLEDSLPGVREHLLTVVSVARGARLKLFWNVRLFALAQGGATSLAALEAALGDGQRVAWLPAGRTLPDLPPECRPPGLLLAHHGPCVDVVKRVLGKRARELPAKELDELEKLARRLREKKKPGLRQEGAVLVAAEAARGQLALDPTLTRSRVEVLHDGIVLEAQHSLPSQGFPFVASVECPHLQPRPGYQGFVVDERWQEVVAALQAAHQVALANLCARPPGPAWYPAIHKLLEAEPGRLTPALEGCALWSAQPEPVSLRAIRHEQERRGRVLTARPEEAAEADLPALLNVPFVLVNPSGLLRKLAAELVLEPCGGEAERRRRERSFLAQPEVVPVAVPGKALLRRALPPPFAGEVVLGSQRRGRILYHYLNRLLWEEPGWPCALGAAVQSSDLTPTDDYRDVRRDEGYRAARAAVEQAASLAVGEAARRKLSLDWTALALWPALDPAVREQVWQVDFLPQAGGGMISPARVCAGRSEVPYLSACPGPAPAEATLLLGAQRLEEVTTLLGLPLRNVDADYAEAQRLAARHRALRRLQGKPPAHWLEVPFDAARLRGTLAIPRKPMSQVVLLEGGGPVGWYRPRLPLVGRLEGHFRLTEATQMDLGPEQRRQLQQAGLALYQELAAGYVAARHQRLLLTLLRAEWRSLEGTAVGRLPLFATISGWASLDALLEEQREEGHLLAVERGVTLPAGESRLYPLLAPAEQLETLQAVFGKKLRALRSPGWAERLAALKAVLFPPPAPRARPAPRTAPRQEEVHPRPEEPHGPTTADRVISWVASHLPTFTWGEAPEKDTPERRLLAALRRHASLCVQGEARRHCRPILEKMRWGKNLLGTKACWFDSEGVLILNRNHRAMSRALETHETDPATVPIVLIHLFCVINRHLEAVTDQHEKTFLMDLGTTLAQAFQGAGSD